MEPLTPAERRGALVVVLLLALGAGYDLWRAGAPASAPPADRAAFTRPGLAAPDPAADGPDGAAAHPPVPDSGGARIDLNRATARELDVLPGVGAVLSARIVAHRERHGPFQSPEELLAVRGIGPRLFARIAPLVTVGRPVLPAPPAR